VSECDLWGPRLREALRRHLDLDREGVIDLRRRLLRADWGLEGILRASLSSRRSRSPLRRYAATIADLYKGISRATGARVLIDSSKTPVDAYLVAALTDVDLYLVHVVRDPRGCAYSWQRLKRSFEPNVYLPTRSPARSSLNWLQTNLAIEAVLRPSLGRRYARIRYEDFARHPRSVARELLGLVGEPAADLPFRGDTRIALAPGHTVSGNPIRFTTGELDIRPDDEWRTRIDARSRLLATVPALPLMPHYGYPLRSA
jgi:Sulfotransferase domain